MGWVLIVYGLILGFITWILGSKPWFDENSSHLIKNTATHDYHFEWGVALQNPLIKILWVIWGVMLLIHLLAGGHRRP
jgi:steroid 5-alpha reductase family enzyme